MEIIIIDDDKIIAMIHQKLLTLQGIYSTRIFTQATEAFEYLNEYAHDVEKQFLILLDINMPSMDGWEFANKAEKLKNLDNCTFYFVTSSVNEKDRIRAKKINLIQGLIEKPLTKNKMKTLTDKLDKVFQ
ncbi:response regulator [Christiangramia aquimixticola]|uniref:response regulator n=1 Tax=Christiangramia aquimixticola TaxID=1697558 RepID=UPI003AA82CB8